MLRINSTAGSYNFKGLCAPINTGTHSVNVKGSENPAAAKQPQRDVFVKSPVFNKNDISFGYYFELKKPKGIPCAYCGKECASKDEILYIGTLKGKKFADEIDKFVSQDKALLNSRQRHAVNKLKLTALEFPDKDGREILPVVYTRARNRMIFKQSNIYSKIEEYADKIGVRELSEYMDVVRQQDVVLKQNIPFHKLQEFLFNNSQIQFRKDVIRNIQNIAKNNYKKEDRAVWTQIFDEAEKLPSSKNDGDAYLVKFISKALRKDPKIENELIPISEDEVALFYSTLLFPFLSSAEHIKPHSHNGASDSSNYLVTHTHCNSVRGNTPWFQYTREHPEVFDNIIKNLKKIKSDRSIKAAAPNINVYEYVTNVSKQLKSELKDAKNNPAARKFLKDLNQTVYTNNQKYVKQRYSQGR